MEGLPKLPGMNFENRIKLNHHVSHSLDYRNGYRIPKKTLYGIGHDPLKEDSIQFHKELNDTTMFDPKLMYGIINHPQIQPFRPHFVVYDKMVLQFFGYINPKIKMEDSNLQIRYVKIYYYLEDESMSVYEVNAVQPGIDQGKFVRRGKMINPKKGDYYNWKDLNVGIDIEINGIVLHISDCDTFTRNFMLSQGIELNEVEYPPVEKSVRMDRYATPTVNAPRTNLLTPLLTDEKRRQFIEWQGKVLHFDCLLDETDRSNSNCMTYKLFYYLEDDTVSIKELRENREGRHKFSMMLKKTKLPKNWKKQPATYPSVLLEVIDNNPDDFYTPIDFRVGETLSVFGRKFLLLDCDAFTRQYYKEVLKMDQGEKLDIHFPQKSVQIRALPDYMGLGTPEDSLASCYRLRPKSPKKDVITYLLNANKSLRYECVLDTAHPEDKNRKFILQYWLSDGTITIVEPPIQNSGIIGGRFLGKTRVIRPGSDPNYPEYYTPRDMHIGAILLINSNRMKVVGADLYVLRYMLEHPECFTQESIEGIKRYHRDQGHWSDAGELQECEKPNSEKVKDLQETQKEIDEYEEYLRRYSVAKGNHEGDELPKLEYEINSHEKISESELDLRPQIIKTKSSQIDPHEVTLPNDPCSEQLILAKCCQQNDNENEDNPHRVVRFK